MLGRWYKKYTPQECARLCSKISNFYGSSCTHFSRQWITSRIQEHSDTCGRDGEVHMILLGAMRTSRALLAARISSNSSSGSHVPT